MNKKQKFSLASLACLILVFFGCQNSNDEVRENEAEQNIVDKREQSKPSADYENEGADKPAVTDEDTADEQVREDDCDPSQKNKDEQCTLIPVGQCLGCHSANGGQKAVNMDAAQTIMTKSKKMCEKKVKAFMNRNKSQRTAPKFISTNKSCKFNHAICNKNGKCVPTTVSVARLKQIMESRQKMMQQQQGADAGSAER